MMISGKALLPLALAAATLQPTIAKADYSKCTKQMQKMGYFILDVDSDWDRPYDKFSAVKNGKEYDIWVNKNTCKIVQSILDNDRDW